jgi:hypothetical protein
MTKQQLIDLVQKLKTLSTSAPTLSAKLSTDGEKIKPKKASTTAKRQALLDSI